MPDAPDKLTVTDTGIAPYIYFEGAPNFGFTVSGLLPPRR
jgi:hypothetical protein